MKTHVQRIYCCLEQLFEWKFFVPACLLVAAVLRLAWVLSVPNTQVSDFKLYLAWGREIAAGHGYTDHGRPTAYYPIGYPAFLGAMFRVFGDSVLVGKLAGIFVYLGIIYFSYKLAFTMFRSRFVAGFSAMVLAVYPNHIAYSSVLLSEPLWTCGILAAIWLVFISVNRTYLLLAAGIVFGLANIVRPLGIPMMLVAFVTVFWSYRASIRRGQLAVGLVLLLLGFCIGVCPYAIRNYMVFGRATIVSLNSGMNMLLGNNPYANGTYPNDRTIHDKVLALVDCRSDEFERNDLYNRYAINYICKHPLRTVSLWPKKLVYLFAFEVDGINRNLDGLKPGSPIRYLKVVTQGVYVLVMMSCLAAIIVYLKRFRCNHARQYLPPTGLWILAMWTGIHVVVLGSSRYHYPMIPWIVMYASAWFMYLAKGEFVSGMKTDVSESRFPEQVKHAQQLSIKH
ncbi:MAG: hypothetical protein ABFD49_11385 [Armatimonadota bacterium]|nr:glycosyltransferase family 39 protein [bacterium]